MTLAIRNVYILLLKREYEYMDINMRLGLAKMSMSRLQ